DQNSNNDDVCAISPESDKFRIRCCSSTLTRNDLCRLSTKTDVEILVKDLALSFDYQPDMCSTLISLYATPGLQWVFNGTGGTAFLPPLSVFQSIPLSIIVSQLSKEKVLLAARDIPTLPAASQILYLKGKLVL